MLVNLCQGMVEHGHLVDLLVVRSDSEHLDGLPDSVQMVNLGTRHTFGSIFALTRYLRKERPEALLAAKDRAARVAVIARWLSRANCRLVFRIGTTVSAALEGRHALRRWSWYLPASRCSAVRREGDRRGTAAQTPTKYSARIGLTRSRGAEGQRLLAEKTSGVGENFDSRRLPKSEGRTNSQSAPASFRLLHT